MGVNIYTLQDYPSRKSWGFENQFTDTHYIELKKTSVAVGLVPKPRPSRLLSECHYVREVTRWALLLGYYCNTAFMWHSIFLLILASVHHSRTSALLHISTMGCLHLLRMYRPKLGYKCPFQPKIREMSARQVQ